VQDAVAARAVAVDAAGIPFTAARAGGASAVQAAGDRAGTHPFQISLENIPDDRRLTAFSTVARDPLSFLGIRANDRHFWHQVS
jgi:hypothetical protein